ncbi:MAG: hypothetical protein O6761_06930 [Thaumarchaeota archaeon]|nr:hypothetical protein [Nitrososphaerota archaeon]
MTEPWIQTNFVRGLKGNMLPFGTKLLKIKVPGAKWMTGILLKKNPVGSYNIIQIEQSGGHNNPWKDKVVFEMLTVKNRIISPMEKCDYKVIIRASKLGIQGMTDEFYIGDQ